MTNRSEAFGRLLKAGISSIVNCEGKKAPIIEDELGQLIGVSGDSIQRYKAGHLPPEPRTVQILAEAAISRGFLGREWLQRFLHAARYPFADKLLDQLCPIGPARTRPPHVYENLPAPTYSQFVMRTQAFAEVIDGLGKRSAAVLIVGMGGNGKTSLAREVADACLKGSSDIPQFDAAVWISDKDRPGITNLSVVLDEIARTLDYPGFTQLEHEEKRREVEQLLKRQRVLIVVDNFETVNDSALLGWLLNLPEPSKTLITTREYRREFRRSSWPVDLRGMTEDEAKNLIAERVRVLKIEKLVGNLTQLEPLLAATGGNPKALEVTLGLMKYERRPIQEVVEDLYAARGDLFDDLFTRAWALLDEAARRVLLSMTFFPDSASNEALSATADVTDFAFERAVERLSDLAFLDVQQADLSSASRYTLHPLVHAFARAHLRVQPGFEIGARDRWISWYIALAEQVGYCPDNVDRLMLLDVEQKTIFRAMEWVYQAHRYAEVVRFGAGAMYFFYVRGLWDKWFEANEMRLEAARGLQDFSEEVHALAYEVQMLSRQGRVKEAAKFRQELDVCIRGKNLPEEAFFLVQHCIGAYNLAMGDLSAAQSAWEVLLAAPNRLSHYRSVASHQWLGLCLYYQGQLEEARSLFLEALKDALEQNYGRYILFNQIRLAAIAIDSGHLEQGANDLAESYELACRFNDREQLAYTQRLYARLHILRGDLPAARAAFTEAIDLFERVGIHRELAEARAEFAQLGVEATAIS